MLIKIHLIVTWTWLGIHLPTEALGPRHGEVRKAHQMLNAVLLTDRHVTAAIVPLTHCVGRQHSWASQWLQRIMRWSNSRPTQPSIPTESINKNQLRLGSQRQLWFIPFVDKRVDVQAKLWNPSTTRAIPEPFCSEVLPSRRSAILVFNQDNSYINRTPIEMTLYRVYRKFKKPIVPASVPCPNRLSLSCSSPTCWRLLRSLTTATAASAPSALRSADKSSVYTRMHARHANYQDRKLKRHSCHAKEK